MELKFIQNLMKLLKETDIREFEMEEDKVKIYLKKGNGIQSYTPVAEAFVEEPVEVKEYMEVKSQYIGKFYYKNKEGESQIKAGQEVKEGQKLGYVDTMGIKNDVVATVAGKIAEVVVKNGNIADYGKVLVKIEKN